VRSGGAPRVRLEVLSLSSRKAALKLELTSESHVIIGQDLEL
jgi:hypothetical protein